MCKVAPEGIRDADLPVEFVDAAKERGAKKTDPAHSEIPQEVSNQPQQRSSATSIITSSVSEMGRLQMYYRLCNHTADGCRLTDKRAVQLSLVHAQPHLFAWFSPSSCFRLLTLPSQHPVRSGMCSRWILYVSI